ncbi:divisome protein SepX/GlpR [Gordonia crocea]|uniref:Transmembrane protein n=1 Tax=Gordonia crocea TaxID=589162 RepID=A0A7I9UUW9_9ACTN|nr:gephyrin-like molybdotransferase receptor GlpR [Gordonia crocea]GED97004.1 hypothetical protein nbrc107697_10430 [Gordonia crocea]
MPNSVLWVCLVAIWLFVLVPMVIQGRPEIRKSTPVAAATRVIKRGEDAVRRRRVGAGSHPHDPDYQPKGRPKRTASAARLGEADSDKADETADVEAEKVESEAVDPSRVPGKVPNRKRTRRTVAARMRRVVSVTTSRPEVDEITEVIPAVGADESAPARATAGSLVDDDAIIEAEIVDDEVRIVEVETVEVIDVETTERIDLVGDDSPTQKIDKVVDEPTVPTLFDLDEDSATTTAVAEAADEVDEPVVESAADSTDDADETVSAVVDETADESGEEPVAESEIDTAAETDTAAEVDVEAAAVADDKDLDDEADDDLVDDLNEVDDDDGDEGDGPSAQWDDVDPNELTQVMMTRPGRGGYDPEVDRQRLELKYKERQRVLVTLVVLTLLAVGAGVLFSTPGWIAAGVAGFSLVAYLVFLRRAVTTEAQVRNRRLERLERNRREEVARRRRDIVELSEGDVAPPPRPRVRRPSGMQVVAIDDEDPAFDHLPVYQQPRMMRADDDYRRAAVG